MMTRLRAIFFALALLGTGAAAAGGAEDKVQAIRDALAAGTPVVLAVAAELPTGDSESETYADWAAYLNDFAAAHSGFAIMAMDKQEASRLLAEPPALENGYATIFVRSADSAILYDGPVLEEIVYDAAASYLEAPDDGRFDAAMFAPYSFQLK
jgi:hypothetical protein